MHSLSRLPFPSQAPGFCPHTCCVGLLVLDILYTQSHSISGFFFLIIYFICFLLRQFPCVAKAVLEFTIDQAASAFWVLALKVCLTLPGYAWLFLAAFSKFMCIVANPHFLSFHTIAWLAMPHTHQFVCFSGLGLSWGMASWIFAYVCPWKNVFSFPGHRARGIADSYGNLNFEELPNCSQVIAQFSCNSSRAGVLSLLTTLN